MKGTRLLIGFFAVLIMTACFANYAKAGKDYVYLMYLPFAKGQTWYCVQGNSESYSHHGTLEYAYDFKKWMGMDASFGQNVFSPINGEVAEKRTDAPDYALNDEKCKENNYGWGNTLLLKDDETGKFVRFAHLKYGSIPDDLMVGDEVVMGQKIGNVGNSGWSSGPHLHVHMQNKKDGEDDPTGDDSIKFNFIEGPVETDTTLKSELQPKTFVLDNDGNRSLSSEFFFADAYKYSSPWWFETYDPEPGEVTGEGSEHAVYNVGKMPWFAWKFQLKNSGWYGLYVRYQCKPYNDNRVKYRTYSASSPKPTRYVDQSKCYPQSKSGWKLLYIGYFKKLEYYYLKAEPTHFSKSIEADAIKLQGFW